MPVVKYSTLSCSPANQVTSGACQDGVGKHQPRHDRGGRNGPTEPALGLTDGAVQRPMMNVVDERPIVEARANGCEPAAHKPVEEPIDLVPVRDAR